MKTSACKCNLLERVASIDSGAWDQFQSLLLLHIGIESGNQPTLAVQRAGYQLVE